LDASTLPQSGNTVASAPPSVGCVDANHDVVQVRVDCVCLCVPVCANHDVVQVRVNCVCLPDC
jgi:hypothetical protein